MGERIFLRFIPVFIFGCVFTFILIKNYHVSFFGDVIVLLIVTIFWVFFFCRNIYRDICELRASKHWFNMLPTFTGVMFFLLNVSVSRYYENKVSAPALLFAVYDAGVTQFTISLNQDGSYVMSNGTGLGQCYFYGSYSIDGDTIVLDKNNIDGVIVSDRLLIQDSPNDYSASTRVVCQINDQGEKIDNYFNFMVISDFRKKVNSPSENP